MDNILERRSKVDFFDPNTPFAFSIAPTAPRHFPEVMEGDNGKKAVHRSALLVGNYQMMGDGSMALRLLGAIEKDSDLAREYPDATGVVGEIRTMLAGESIEGDLKNILAMVRAGELPTDKPFILGIVPESEDDAPHIVFYRFVKDGDAARAIEL